MSDAVIDPGDWVAALPYALGFYPDESLLIASVTDNTSTMQPPPDFVLAIGLPLSVGIDMLCAQLTLSLTNYGARMAVVIVVGATTDTPEPELPHRQLVNEIVAAATNAGVSIARQIWVPRVQAGIQWHSYDNPHCCGRVPDPTTTVLAAMSTVLGEITYPSRNDLVATLAPVADTILAHRASLLYEAEDERLRMEQDTAGDDLCLVDTAIDRAVEGILPDTDDELIALALALQDHRVRDAVLCPDEPTGAEAAERLWTTLTRGTPAPHRAEPACLLAFAAYVRGDGTLAGIALDQAEAANPDHRLTGLLRGALLTGRSPEQMHTAGLHAATRSRQMIGPPHTPAP